MRKKSIVKLGMLVCTVYIAIQSVTLFNAYKHIRDDLGERAMSISKILKSDINVNDYKEIVDTKQKTEQYYKLQEKVKEIREATNAKYVYVENKIDDSTVEYILDSDGETLGNTDINADNWCFDITESVTIGTNTARWGELITGFTPLLDDDGSVIGLVGVDYEFGLGTQSVRNLLLAEVRDIAIMTLFLAIFMCILYAINSTRDRDMLRHYGDIVNSLTLILSKKSDYTSKHSERVADLSEALATKFFKNEKQIETVRWASLLHDIGKIGISGSILDKPGKLTDAEFKEIKKHPVYSKQMLENIFKNDRSMFNDKEMEIIADIAKYHHERYDGKGYPCGLKGNEIPFMARIVSVADSYEAMTAERPYKKPMSKEAAIEQLVKCSGTQFDPKVVEKFLECVKEGKI